MSIGILTEKGFETTNATGRAAKTRLCFRSWADNADEGVLHLAKRLSFFVPLLFWPLGGLEGLDAMLYGRLSSQKSLCFSKQLRQVVERCPKMIRNELLCCL